MHVRIGNRLIGDGQPCYLVAEIGQNHNGDVYAATRLIGEAVRAGFDAVKFQKQDSDSCYSAERLDAPHPCPDNAYGDTYRDHRAALELSVDDFHHLISRVQYNEWAIDLFASVSDVASLEALEPLNFPAYKIPSRSLTDLPLLRAVAATGRPVILSTGMDGLGAIDAAVAAVRAHHDQVVLLQCTSCYPCPVDQVHLRCMDTLRDRYGLPVGFSDHTVGAYEAAITARAVGACMIEKHVTLSRAQRGTDHAGSVEPDGMRRLVRGVRHVDELLGSPDKVPLDCTRPAQDKLRRGISTCGLST